MTHISLNHTYIFMQQIIIIPSYALDRKHRKLNSEYEMVHFISRIHYFLY